MPTGKAITIASSIEAAVSRSVVGMRSRTKAEAGWPWWKNDLPKLPVAALPTKRASCRGSGSVRPRASRSLARSASGASGIIRATGSPLACRIANVTSVTPAHTTTSLTTRRTKKAVIDDGGDLGDSLQASAAPRRSPEPRLFPRLGVVQPEPLVGARRVLHLLRHAERVVLGEQEDRRGLFSDQPLDLRVRPLALRLIDGRPSLVDEPVQTLDAGVVLAHPAARLGVIERVEHGVGVEHR